MPLTKNALAGVKAGPDDGLNEGEFTGYASVFGNIDSYGDVVMPTAFDADLAAWEAKGDPIPVLFGHNMSDPDYNIGHVVEATTDDHGLKVRVQLDLQNPKSVQVYRLLKGRRINQMSFAYDILRAGWEVRPKENGDDGDTEEYFALHELKIYEVSVVPIGANQETEIVDVKALTRFADHIAGGDAAAVKAGRVLSAKNEESLRTAHDAIGRVLSALDDTDDEEKANGRRPSRKPDEATGASGGPSVDTSAMELLEVEIAAAVAGVA
ncbi:capsid maturation protease [Gordonia phage Tarzan]|uniref:Capsid maturation protease n=1 Tax=Gordonia phage Tarzan TaxID=3038367 RepID=A0AAF0GGD7_9CAUD|nr:capsid maturation protease [Gordonia phage Tarzan]WGH20040.1 capsid maturation protease [Gordonia phage Tarzan]